MAIPALPAQGSTDWYSYATALDAQVRNGSSSVRTLVPGYIAGTDETPLFQPARSDITGVTGRNWLKQHTVLTDGAVSVRLVYANFTRLDQPGDNPLTVSATAYTGTDQWGGFVGRAPVTFGGQASVTIAPGGLAVSDPVAASLARGADLVTGTFVAVQAGGTIPVNYFIGAGWGNRQDTTQTNVLTTSQWSDNTSHWGYGPVAVLVTPRTPAPRLLAIVGDSIVYGVGDYPNHLGFLTRAAVRDHVPAVKVAMPTENSFQWTSMDYTYQRKQLITGATHAIVNYGANDSGYRTVDQYKESIAATWADLRTRGMKVLQMTVGPKTDSTDGWATVGGQTPRSSGAWTVAELATVNDWIRSNPGGQLDGIIDFADMVMTARNSGIWKAGYSTDGTHPSGDGHWQLFQALPDLTTLLV